jgi:hypothetical protein
MKLTIASMLVVTLACLSHPATARAAPAIQRTVSRQNASKPKLAPDATTFVAIPFPSPQPSYVANVVFLPNGTAYFADAQDELASFTRAGVYTRIPVPHAGVSNDLLYAHGVLWTTADEGVVKVAPDGSRRRWFPLTVAGYLTDVESLVAGPDGGIYALAALFPQAGGAQMNMLFRIDATGSITTLPLSVMPVGNGAEAFGADNLLYFGYNDATGASGIARIENDGSLTLFPIAGSYQNTSFVASKGSIYFNELFYDDSAVDGKLGRITTAGVISLTAFPATGPNSSSPSSLSVDKGGNLWVVVDDVFAVNQFFLYQFNIYTGHFNGPYLTGLPNSIYGGPAVAPDDSVWIVLPGSSYRPIGFGIFERGT